jgi:miniconductance mechanosensitive channel
MLELYEGSVSWLELYPELQTLIALTGLILLAWISNWVVKKILVRGLHRALKSTAIGRDDVLSNSGVIRRLANVVPALILASGIKLVPGLSDALVAIVENVCGAFVILTVALAIGNVLTLINSIYERRPNSRTKPIKGYTQVIKIVIYALATILIIATLIDRSPLILLSGLGAMAAVLMLIFQDTILSLVASVQISSNDVVRVGDWVEMPQLSADGDVIDIALHTVKVRNWDNTITSIPTKKFMTDPFKNWRGMQESGGRRIMRSIMLDQQTVHFLDAEERQRLQRFGLLQDYLKEKQTEIDEWNEKLEEQGKEPVNTRRITNIGTFRAYVERYIKSHSGIHQNMTLIVRQLAPGAEGLPLQIYCFTNTVSWNAYEAIQSDLFDHMLSILPEFGLRVYQHPSGMDLRSLKPEALLTPDTPQQA